MLGRSLVEQVPEAEGSARRNGIPIERILLFAAILAAAWPVRKYPITSGLDASWAWALNYAHAKGLIFGRDVIFTYGPLAWLTVPMDVGRNLGEAIAFQIALWLAFAGGIAWFVFIRKIALEKVALFTVCLLAGWRSFHHWDYVGPEIFIAFVALLLLGGAVAEGGSLPYLAGAWSLGWLLIFVKFSAGIVVLSAAALFVLALIAVDRRKGLKSGAAALLTTVFIAMAAWLVCFRSLTDLLRYGRGGLEISAGYSAAMTLRTARAPLLLALFLILSWLLLIVCLLRTRDRVLPLAVAFLGPWLIVLKHSFVRENFHAGMIFAFAPLLWGIVLLFSELRREDLPRLVAPAATPIAILCITIAPASFPTRRPLAADRLPEPLRAAIGSAPVAIFPYELTYAAANNLNFQPLPVLQSYSAYTPYLDEADASFLNSEATGPSLVLFDWQALDGRNPLLDVPATALALYRHYDLEMFAGGHLLLRRRRVPRFGDQPRLLETRQWDWAHPLPVPASGHLLIARVYPQKTLEGAARNLLFRLPAVTLMDFRMPPDVARDGIPLNVLPRNIEEARALFAGEAVPAHNTELAFGGPGARYFRNPVKVEFLEFPEVRIEPAAEGRLSARSMGR